MEETSILLLNGCEQDSQHYWRSAVFLLYTRLPTRPTFPRYAVSHVNNTRGATFARATPFPMSRDAPGPSVSPPTHAQAVRFITSLRSDNQVSGKDGRIELSDDHRDFLRSKGLSDADIERASLDAERPDVLGATPRNTSASPPDAFERAAQAFAHPTEDGPAPQVPPPSYPRSPLALYTASEDRATDSGKLVARIAKSMNSHRYDVLLRFFHMLQLILVLCGSAAAITLAIFRKFLIPRMVKVIEARSQLLNRQIDLFGLLGDRLTKLYGSVTRLLPKDYEPERITVVEKDDNEGEGNGNEEAKSEGEGKGEPQVLTEKPEDKAENAAETTAGPKEETEKSGEADEQEPEEVEEEEPTEQKTILAPIDVTEGLRGSMSNLETALKNMNDLRMINSKNATVTNIDDDGLMDLSMPDPAEEVLSRRTARGEKEFRDSVSGLRAELWAQATTDEEALAIVGNRFSGIYGPSASRVKEGSASEMMQIKAEIRSLKGLMLSRRNFPSFSRIHKPQMQAKPEFPQATDKEKGKETDAGQSEPQTGSTEPAAETTPDKAVPSKKAQGPSEKAEGPSEKAQGPSEKAEGPSEKAEGPSEKTETHSEKAEGLSEKAGTPSEKQADATNAALTESNPAQPTSADNSSTDQGPTENAQSSAPAHDPANSSAGNSNT